MLRTGVTGGYDLVCGFWEPHLGPLGKQQVFVTTEQSLKFQHVSVLKTEFYITFAIERKDNGYFYMFV